MSEKTKLPDLDSMSAKDLTALIQAAEAKRREKMDEAKASLLAKWRAEAEESGLSLDALLPGVSRAGASEGERKRRKDAGGSLPVKFRGPSGETWSGRGRIPKWLQTLEAEGKSRDQFKA